MSRTEDREAAQAIGEAPRFQKSEWRASRVGWLVMSAVVVAAMLGVWGEGPLSEARASSGNGALSVQYERFVRDLGETDLRVRVAPGHTEQGAVRVGIDQDYLAANQVQAVTPEPASSALRGGRLVYEFPATDRAGLLLRLDLRPSGGIGASDATVTVNGAEPVRFTQFRYW